MESKGIEEKAVGTFVEGLLGSPSATRKTRAKRVASNVATAFKNRLDQYHAEVANVKDEMDRLLDINSASTFSTTFDVNAEELVNKHIELIIKKAKLEETLEMISAEYKKLFGLDYVPSVISFE